MRWDDAKAAMIRTKSGTISRAEYARSRTERTSALNAPSQEYPGQKLSKLFAKESYGWYNFAVADIRKTFRALYGFATNDLERAILLQMQIVIRNYEEDYQQFPPEAYQRLDETGTTFGGYRPRRERK